MAGANEGGQWLALGSDERFLKGDALVPRQNGLTETDDSVSIAYRRWDVSDFKTAGFTLFGGTPELFESFVKERFDVMGLQAACFGTLHVFTDALHSADVHRVLGQHTLFKQGLKVFAIECGIEHRSQESLGFRLFPIANGLDQQRAQRLPFELQFAQHVKNLTPERLPGLFEFLE